MLGYFNDNVVKCHTEYITAINNVIHSPKLCIVSEVIMTKCQHYTIHGNLIGPDKTTMLVKKLCSHGVIQKYQDPLEFYSARYKILQ